MMVESVDWAGLVLTNQSQSELSVCRSIVLNDRQVVVVIVF